MIYQWFFNHCTAKWYLIIDYFEGFFFSKNYHNSEMQVLACNSGHLQSHAISVLSRLIGRRELCFDACSHSQPHHDDSHKNAILSQPISIQRFAFPPTLLSVERTHRAINIIFLANAVTGFVIEKYRCSLLNVCSLLW